MHGILCSHIRKHLHLFSSDVASTEGQDRPDTCMSCWLTSLLSQQLLTVQVKDLGKKGQQTTPRGSPTKPQPLQRAGPLEAVKVAVLAWCCSYPYSLCIMSVRVQQLHWHMHRSVLDLLACVIQASVSSILHQSYADAARKSAP